MSDLVSMYSANGTEVRVTPDSVDRMKELGWTEDRPAIVRTQPDPETAEDAEVEDMAPEVGLDEEG